MTIQTGSKGAYVAQWQRLLGVKADGDFGPKTDKAVRAFQKLKGLEVDGVVGTASFVAALPDWPTPEGYPFIGPAKSYRIAKPGRKINRLVMHTMEVPPLAGMSIEIGGRFAAESYPRNASTHYCVDPIYTVQCVETFNIANHAGLANGDSLGIEMAGFSHEGIPITVITNAAKLAADLCRRFNLPCVWLDGEAVKRGERGITGHAECNDAYEGVGEGHRDPGDRFDRERFITLVRGY